jgi:hypothetical protein
MLESVVVVVSELRPIPKSTKTPQKHEAGFLVNYPEESKPNNRQLVMRNLRLL